MRATKAENECTAPDPKRRVVGSRVRGFLPLRKDTAGAKNVD